MDQQNTQKTRPSPGRDTAESALAKKTARQTWNAIRGSRAVNLIYTILFPAILLVTLEWVARGTLDGNRQGNGFFESLQKHFSSFLITYLLLLFLYVCISQLFRRHWPATVVVGLLGYLPAVTTYYKLTMRGEPFLPWDLSQIQDLMNIKSNVQFEVSSAIVVTGILFALLIGVSCLIRMPRLEPARKARRVRYGLSAAALACALLMLFLIFLNPVGTALMGIREDAWMQDRYYRTNGVVTGFLTNLQLLNIGQPEGYSAEEAQRIAEEAMQKAATEKPYYANSPALEGGLPTQPDIIYLMAESFWDVRALQGITYDRELMPNFTKLAAEGASGQLYTPSFGGGTCDVEFEALTGFTVETLPAGSKPFQQYITDDQFSLPQYLKSEGYETLAIHGYGRRFWNRDVAYPRLGIDTFIAEDDFVNPARKRGFISDDAMVDEIIRQYENRESPKDSMFIHAVTMQNHTTYARNRYPAQELVRVTSKPAALPDSTIGQLEDCATGIYEMDAALGKLADYLRTSDRPTILVFWGDHMNPMTDGYHLFEETGFIELGDTGSPNLHKTPLLVWSNYATEQVDVGVVGAYNISPVVMDLYGLEKPPMFAFLAQNLGVLRARSHGYTVNPDGTATTEMTPEQQEFFDKHAILQYEYMFGGKTLPTYAPDPGSLA